MAKFILNTKALIALRGLAGLKLRTLAKRAGISASYLCEIEAGTKVPSPEVAKKIAQALGVDVGSFFGTDSKESWNSSEQR